MTTAHRVFHVQSDSISLMRDERRFDQRSVGRLRVDQPTHLAWDAHSPSKQRAAGKCASNSETAIFAPVLGRSPTSPVNAFRYPPEEPLDGTRTWVSSQTFDPIGGRLLSPIKLAARRGTATSRLAWSNLRMNATDRKSTRLNSSHLGISYAVFCVK